MRGPKHPRCHLLAGSLLGLLCALPGVAAAQSAECTFVAATRSSGQAYLSFLSM